MHNKTSCYVQHICKKLNFHNGMKSRVTLSHTRPCCVVFLRCINTTGHAYIYIYMYTYIYIYIYTMKSVTRKRCSLRYTYIRTCVSTTKIILTPTQQDGGPSINSHRKPVRELRRMVAPNLNIRIIWFIILVVLDKSIRLDFILV